MQFHTKHLVSFAIEKSVLPATNIPNSLLLAKQGQSLTLFLEKSLKRKTGSFNLPHKIKNTVFCCQQPNRDCSKIQATSTRYLIHVLLSCHTPQQTSLITRCPSAAHHIVYFTLSCVALLLCRRPLSAYCTTTPLTNLFLSVHSR